MFTHPAVVVNLKKKYANSHHNRRPIGRVLYISSVVKVCDIVWRETHVI